MDISFSSSHLSLCFPLLFSILYRRMEGRCTLAIDLGGLYTTNAHIEFGFYNVLHRTVALSEVLNE
jgi:hypothetical protein